MPNDNDTQAQFLRRLYSPLTSIEIVTGLLRNALQGHPEPGVEELLATLETDTRHLADLIKILARHIEDTDDGLRINLPESLLNNVQRPISYQEHTGDHTSATSFPIGQIDGTVLVIEDSPTFRSVLGTLLRQAGFEVLETGEGVEGLDLARQHKPDVIILDLVLPVFDGQQLASVLTDDPETRDIPLLVCTALDQDQLAALDPHLRIIHKSQNLNEIPTVVAELIAERRRPIQTTILLIDDDDSTRPLLARGLQEAGYNVIQARTGNEGFRLALRRSIDLIILDLLLPDLDGFDVLRQIRLSNRTLLTPVILLSGMDSAAEKIRGLQLGADDYVTKPFIMDELLARIRALLRRHQLESDASPSTQLPGGVAIDRVITNRIASGTLFAIGYADLDNFKAYNDTFGFLKGDAMIRQTARIITSAVERYGTSQDFVGHIGGDDFVFVTTPDRVEEICRAIIAEFDSLVPLYYDAATRSRGYINQIDRQGHMRRFPLVSISIGVVSNVYRPINHPAQVSDIAVELKKYAKQQSGSYYIIDRRFQADAPMPDGSMPADTGQGTSNPLP